MTVGYTRSRIPPWGLAGGADGTPNFVEVIRASGGRELYSLASGVIVNKGDVIRIVTGNGVGYGDPRERDRQAVLEDVGSGYLTASRAEQAYGVDADATLKRGMAGASQEPGHDQQGLGACPRIF